MPVMAAAVVEVAEPLTVRVPEPREMVPPGPLMAEKVWDLLERLRVVPGSV